MVKYDLNWLKGKGFFSKETQFEIEDKRVIVDPDNLFAYIEVSSNDEIEKSRREILSSFPRVKYIWFYFPQEEKIKVFRRYGGELPWFWYKPNLKGELAKSREDKLNKFSTEDINILFDTRDVAEMFYWQLWKERIKLARGIKELKEDKNKLLVVQYLFDRLIFFYFIAQLGLIKIKNEEKEWKLDRKGTREFFEWICNKLPEKDLQDFLNKIFFDVLGKYEESGWSSKKFELGNEKFSVIAPSLDGGLFIEKKIEGKRESEIKIQGLKELILEILNKYNWIIGEEIPEEDAIGELTPEIIGHIYERFVVSLDQIGIEKIKLNEVEAVKEELRYGRKKIGAYYTPEEITNYISVNTIYPYIRERLKDKFGNIGESLIDDLFKKNSFNKEELAIVKYLYFEILTKIRICDNACGSGSFLIAAGNVLLRLYSRVLKILEEYLSQDNDTKGVLKAVRKSPARNYYIVRQIIVNNLYGVDIMEGAIEIAKLRLWLWLISQINPQEIENKKIETLPNLDFNLMVGNSLIGFVDIDDVEFDFVPIKSKEKLKTLTTKQYLITASIDKEKVKWLRDLAKKKQEFKTLSTNDAMKLKEELNKQLEQARKFLDEKFLQLLKSQGIEISKEEFLRLKPFHWGFEFYEVFDLEKPKEERGFDIVIGNPPYIENKKMKNEIEKEIIKTIFNSAYKLFDYSVVFIERSYQHLKKNGFFSYIITNKFIATDYGIKIRQFILENTELRELLDVSHIEVFRGVAIYPIIIIFQKHEKKDNTLIGLNVSNEQEISNKSFEKIFIPQEKLLQSPNFIFDISGNFIVCDKIRRNKHVILLGDLGDFYYRILGFTDWVKILKHVYRSKDKHGEYLKFIGTTNIKQFSVDESIPFKVAKQSFKNCYLKYSNSFDKNSWEIFKKEKLLIKEVSLVLTTAYDPGVYANLTGMYCFIPTDSRVSIFYLLGLLNSKILDFYFRSLYGSTHMAGGYLRFNGSYLKELPIRIPLNNSELIIIETVSKYLFLLSKIKDEETYKCMVDILNFLVYELYFKEELKTNLLQLVKPYLKDIENLKSDEEKLKVIKQVVEKIKGDKKIMSEIEKIKSHPWVKIIEGRKNEL
jgi:hypothetical protein